MEKYVAYYRVSTKGQGISGLGLEAQQAAVTAFTRCTQCIIASYTDIESGKENNRPQLIRAIAHAKQSGAKLIIAKLDRLSRNAAFIFTLRDSGIEFVCADMPEANTLNIGIFASMAQYERELISARTKAALAALKARGVRLGNPGNLGPQATARSVEVRKAKAANNPNTIKATNYAKTMRNKENLTLRAICKRLNDEGFTTPTGKPFKPESVRVLLAK